MTAVRARASALLALAGVSGAAVFGVAGAHGTAAQEPLAATTTDRPLATAVQQDQAEGFPVFARSRSALDAMSLEAAEQVGNSTHSGRNLDLSRAISTPTGKGWAVPGNGTVCLVVPDPIDGYAVTCTQTKRALTHGLLAMLIRPDRPNLTYLTMLRPSGADVFATTSDGQTRALVADVDGVVSAGLVGATELTVTTDSRTERIAMPVPPPTKPSSFRDCGNGRIIDAGTACPPPG